MAGLTAPHEQRRRTDVISFLFKDHPIAARYDLDLASRTLVISFMTLAELDRWAIHAKWGEARRSPLYEMG
jgi:hypothetical protein